VEESDYALALGEASDPSQESGEEEREAEGDADVGEDQLALGELADADAAGQHPRHVADDQTPKELQ